jgi:hypothetical protein
MGHLRNIYYRVYYVRQPGVVLRLAQIREAMSEIERDSLLPEYSTFTDYLNLVVM